MKAFFLLIGAAALSGCVAYAPDAFEAPYQSGTLYGVEQPGYGPGYWHGHGATVVPYGAYGYPSYAAPYGYGYPAYPRFYPRRAPGLHPHAHPRTDPHPHLHPRPHAQDPGGRNRDRDGDLRPNRSDRDGDGAPDRYDRRPGDRSRR